MENTNTLPNQNISTNSQTSPVTVANQKNISASDSQIFIHPDHESGSLVIPQDRGKKKVKKTDLQMILITLVIGFLLVAGSGLFFVLLPRSQNVTFANSIKETLDSTSAGIKKVDRSLQVLYKAITNQTENVTLISTKEDFRLSAEKKDNLYGVLKSASYLVKQSVDSINKKEVVKGFAAPDGDPNEIARKHKELAQDISEQAQKASESNSEFSTIISKISTKGSEKLKEKSSKLAEKTNKYIDQATDTANYYIALNDATIKLQTMAITLSANKNDIDNTIGELTSLRNSFSNYNKDELPDEIDNFNKDVVSVFDLLLQLFQTIKKGDLNNLESITAVEAKFSSDLEAIALKLTYDEVNFWQNNTTLNSYNKLSENQLEVQQEAEDLKDKNNFFLLNWVGVS